MKNRNVQSGIPKPSRMERIADEIEEKKKAIITVLGGAVIAATALVVSSQESGPAGRYAEESSNSHEQLCQDVVVVVEEGDGPWTVAKKAGVEPTNELIVELSKGGHMRNLTAEATGRDPAKLWPGDEVRVTDPNCGH